MLRNYFKIAVRNIFKNKLYSFVNIAGLAIGMAACILILLWVTDEINYNGFNKNLDKIFAIPQTQHYQTIGDFTVMATPLPLGPALKEEIPEIEYITRWEAYLGKRKITYNDKTFNEQVNFADPDFFKIFSFNFIEGDRANALEDVSSIIITKEMAEKYFGNEDPIGKILRMDDKYDMKVSGVVNNVPRNSDIQFDMLIPVELMENLGYNLNNWGSNMLNTFVLLKNPTQAAGISKKIEGRLKQEINAPTAGKLFLFPFSQYHLHSITGSGGKIVLVVIFSVIAFFILFIACINFMNLTTARSAKRATEVGIKKVVGATRSQVAKQFFGESILLTFISLAFALLLVEVFLPFFNNISQKTLTLGDASLTTVMLILSITIVTGIISGIYPAIVLSSFKPIDTLKSKITARTSRFSLRRVLVVLQFAISIILIIGTVIVYLQLHYILNKDIGLDKDNIVYINLSDELQKNPEALKSELLRNSNISSASVSGLLPIQIYSNGGGWKWEGKDPNQEELVSNISVDNDFLKTYDIKLKAGRFYSKEYPADDSMSIVINESFEKLMGFQNAVGKILSRGDRSWNIIGVVNDFNFTQLQNKIGPLIIFPDPTPRYLAIKVNNTGLSETLDFIDKTCKQFDAKFVFDYEFLDKTFEKNYESQLRLGKLFNAFALLAIIISCLGLLGLASYVAELRTKEIGIRKVLGATSLQIVKLISKEFLLLVIIGNIIACPVAYYLVNRWLQDFAFRISIDWWVFVLAGGLTLLIALATVSIQAIKAATANPANSLKYE